MREVRPSSSPTSSIGCFSVWVFIFWAKRKPFESIFVGTSLALPRVYASCDSLLDCAFVLRISALYRAKDGDITISCLPESTAKVHECWRAKFVRIRKFPRYNDDQCRVYQDDSASLSKHAVEEALCFPCALKCSLNHFLSPPLAGQHRRLQR